MTIEEQIMATGLVSIGHEDMAFLNETDQAAFAMVRRSGLGASDSSILLGVNKWKTIEDLITEKKSIGLTPEELEVKNKESVRKGHDLEPLILSKFAEKFHVEVHKPKPMYRLNCLDCLTINFDGVISLDGYLVPVEAKFVSTYGDKYWDKTKSIDSLIAGTSYQCYHGEIKDYIETVAGLYGIPPYYYTQIQQQLLGLGADFGYFAVLFDKNWDFRAFKIHADAYVQEQLKIVAKETWSKIKGEQ